MNITLRYRHCSTNKVFSVTFHQNTPFTKLGREAAAKHFGDTNFMSF
jgi:hypothetical protein